MIRDGGAAVNTRFVQNSLFLLKYQISEQAGKITLIQAVQSQGMCCVQGLLVVLSGYSVLQFGKVGCAAAGVILVHYVDRGIEGDVLSDKGKYV